MSLCFVALSSNELVLQDQLNDSIAKTEVLAGVKVEILSVPVHKDSVKIVWVTHNFGFLGGSLGCAEGEKITRAFEYGLEHILPVCVQCRSGGARMQEGTSSLMQMAKVSVAVSALQAKGLPFISVLADPTYGGVSASYAMQSDVRLAVSDDTRIGFAGPAVILNTMCEANQTVFDQKCPTDFQAANFVYENGQVDKILNLSIDNGKSLQDGIETAVAQIAGLLVANHTTGTTMEHASAHISKKIVESGVEIAVQDVSAAENVEELFNYTKSRLIDRPQTQDIIASVFDNFVELSGDGKVGRDVCLRGGVASFLGIACVVIATYKGHTPTDMLNANYGMPSPHGYRTALRLMKLAEKFHLPVVTLVDTVGAWPTFECERIGQSEAIASNLTVMAGLKVPIITLMVGEGGSGGALGICMGNVIGMLSGGYFGVISPEGAASILGRYKDDAHKAIQFPKDCQELAKAQCIYAHQLKSLGVVDTIIWESDMTAGEGARETYKDFPILRSRIHSFLVHSLVNLNKMSEEELVEQRYNKYRALGTYSLLEAPERTLAIEDAKSKATKKPAASTGAKGSKRTSSLLVEHLADEVVLGGMSKYRKLAPTAIAASTNCDDIPVPHINVQPFGKGFPAGIEDRRTAKQVLDTMGPEYLCRTWIQQQSKFRVLLTDTTMRDAHQSLLATRVRTRDLVAGANIARELLKDVFSLECWGGATFDVCMRFLDECPWERLRQIRAACPDTCLQMLIRGANAVGYTSYADNVVEEFVMLAAKNGMDVFRIFDCFNVMDNMKVCIDAVLKTGKVAEVCICYTGNLLTSEIYNVEYYRNLAKEIKAAGAHILAIKDMAGLLRPLEVKPLMKALREVVGTEIPIHFHTHATSSGSLVTCMEMAREGCEIIDFTTASMADGTSQPSLNAFLAMMQGAEKDTRINYMDVEPYDRYWTKVRDMYSPFESGMKAGTARVYDHQIPGGQYSNLLVQCQSMGLSADAWENVLNAYRDVNLLFGDIVKVTPSSKCVGDLALYLVTRGLTCKDLQDPAKAGTVDFPESVVGLLMGDLGFPHRGFPKAIEDMVLKGAQKRSIRAGLQIPPCDFAANIANLSKKFNTVSYMICYGVSLDYFN